LTGVYAGSGGYRRTADQACPRGSEALATLYLRYRDRLYAWFRARAPEAAASELTAELFAQVALGLKRFRDEADGSAAPWLYGIAKNLLRRYHEQESQNGKGSRA
jgi:DNA-directed RNA polymerase specialized sigma24 family protein